MTEPKWTRSQMERMVMEIVVQTSREYVSDVIRKVYKKYLWMGMSNAQMQDFIERHEKGDFREHKTEYDGRTY